jgi:hypothetical protein
MFLLLIIEIASAAEEFAPIVISGELIILPKLTLNGLLFSADTRYSMSLSVTIPIASLELESFRGN